MKKSLIALAVAGALTAPMIAQADATLYGRFSVEAVKTDAKTLDITDEIGSRIGIKGDVDLGLEGTKGLYHGEWFARTNGGDFGGARLAYIGATGDWGTVTTGRQYVPHWAMNANAYVANNPFAAESGFVGNTFKRNSNTLAYTSPNMSGVTLMAAIVASGQAESGSHETLDVYNVAAKYSANNLTLVASVVDSKTDGAHGDIEVWGVSAKYKMDDLTVMARYEEREEGTDEIDAIALGANYAIGNTILKAGWTQLDEDTAATNDKGDIYVLEVAQKMGKGQLYVGYTNFSDVKRSVGGSVNLVDTGATGNDDAAYVGYMLSF